MHYYSFGIALAVCLIGLVVWRPTAHEAGRVMFAAGLLVALLRAGATGLFASGAGPMIYASVGISLAVCLIGLVMWRPAPREAGVIMFGAGLLVALIRCGVAAFVVT